MKHKKINIEVGIPGRGWEKYSHSYLISVDGKFRSGGVVENLNALFAKMKFYINYLKRPKSTEKCRVCGK